MPFSKISFDTAIISIETKRKSDVSEISIYREINQKIVKKVSYKAKGRMVDARKESMLIFLKNNYFLKKYLLFGIFRMLCFLVTTNFKFALFIML